MLIVLRVVMENALTFLNTTHKSPEHRQYVWLLIDSKIIPALFIAGVGKRSLQRSVYSILDGEFVDGNRYAWAPMEIPINTNTSN